jgi:ketosteroid isomerase-like protein
MQAFITNSAATPISRPGVVDGGPEATLQAFIQAFDNLDWDKFPSFFADDATVFYPRAVARRAQGRAEIEANFRQVLKACPEGVAR